MSGIGRREGNELVSVNSKSEVIDPCTDLLSESQYWTWLRDLSF